MPHKKIHPVGSISLDFHSRPLSAYGHSTPPPYTKKEAGRKRPASHIQKYDLHRGLTGIKYSKENYHGTSKMERGTVWDR